MNEETEVKDQSAPSEPAAAPQSSAGKRYRAIKGIQNDELKIQVAENEEVPQALIDACPELLTHFDPPVVKEV